VPTEDSDVDLLVVIPFEGKRVKKSAKIELAVHAGFPMDLIAITPVRLKQRLEMEDFFLREIVEEGQVLYESNHAEMG
jgi:predicted nucleotidyltransferase